MTFARFLALLCAFSFVAEAAQAFTSRRGVRVNPVNSVVFEAVPRGGTHGSAYWCAAGDYAQRELRAPWDAQIYVARGLGPSETTNRRSAVQFTLDPAAAGVTPVKSYRLNAFKPGEHMSVRQAFNYCMESPVVWN